MKLVSEQDFLKLFPNFKLVNRDEDLDRISSILCRKKNNSLLIMGPRGVGMTALVIGLLQLKEKKDTSFDILSKQFFVLDVDALFASGDGQEINNEFQQIIRNMERTPNSVLIILDAYNFYEGAQNSGNIHFVNTLNHADKPGSFQVIMTVTDDQLNNVYSKNNRINDFYTLYDVKELGGQKLEEVIKYTSRELVDFHGIEITEEAIQEAIYLTTKYREDFGLGTTQPAKTIALLDRALSGYKQAVNRDHPALCKLREEIRCCKDKNKKEQLQAVYDESFADWTNTKEEIQRLACEQSENEILRIKYTNELEKVREKEQENAKANADTEEIADFKQLMQRGFDSKEVRELKNQIKVINSQLEKNIEKYKKLVASIHNNLALDKAALIDSFSKISGISSAKLDENEIETLKNLEANLLERIYGQDANMKHIANAIKVAKLDTLKDSGPAASFLLIGASGAGKTETCKALAQNLFGDEKALIRFDMSEYMEKHAVAKLIGAPPGYEGFECGGILTNTVRKNPVGIYLFDEIEKAHPDVFNIFLQILSDGRLTDNIGRTVDFSETIVVMTSNIGQKYYLDASLSNEEARRLANEELNNTYRSELLNRFNGRENILHFDKLSSEVVEKIVKREINKLNESYQSKGLAIEISDTDITNFCKDHYDVVRGARGLPGYIKANLRPIVVNHMLEAPEERGVFKVKYNKEKQIFEVKFKKE